MKDELLLEVFVGKALAEVLSDASDEGLVLLQQGFGGVFVPVLPGECPADVFLILFFVEHVRSLSGARSLLYFRMHSEYQNIHSISNRLRWL